MCRGTPYDLDFGLVRLLAEEVDMELPMITNLEKSWKSIMPKLLRTDRKGPLPGWPPKDYPAKGTFPNWLEWYMRQPYGGWVGEAHMTYSTTCSAMKRPGMPPQVEANHPRANFWIWPAVLPRFYWDNLQRHMLGKARALNKPLPHGYRKHWALPRNEFDPESPGDPIPRETTHMTIVEDPYDPTYDFWVPEISSASK